MHSVLPTVRPEFDSRIAQGLRKFYLYATDYMRERIAYAVVNSTILYGFGAT